MADRADNFQRPNNATAIGQPSDGGPLWNVLSGTFGINGHALYASVTAADSFAVLSSDLHDAAVACTVQALGDNPGLIARVVDANNLVLCNMSGYGTDIYERVGGGYNLKATTATVPANGDYVVLSVTGTAATVAINNTIILNATVPAFAGAMNHGFRFSFDTNSRLTNFSISQNTLTIPTPHWKNLPQIFPNDAATVWVRRAKYFSQPFKATFSAATQQFTEYPAGTPIPWYFLSSWRAT